MEQYHRKLINDCMSELVYVTFNLNTIVDILLEKTVINEWMKDYILDDDGESDSKTKLYELIQGRGPQAFSALCKVLEETGNLEARDILTLYKTSKKKEEQLLDKTFDKLILEHDDSYVKVHPERKRMDNYEDNLNPRAYLMGSNPKGHALILNINIIKDRDERKGSKVDLENLKKLFKGLGYIVHPKEDLTEKEFKNVIKEFINICHTEKANSIVVFIMSHGESGKNSRSANILAADGIAINTDWIIDQFLPKKKPAKTIPKLFFIQACRGKNSDFGWKNCDGENNALQIDSSNISATETIYNRSYNDIFIAFATVPGYTAKRDPIDGSWFVQKLCEVIRTNAYNKDLGSMMLIVDSEVQKLSSTQHGSQTVEWLCRGFNKRFYFNPGLYDDNSDHDSSITTSTNSTDL
ncbi:caspase-3-like isoform X1 [Rhopalosiphum padi]|uniref:caspase-3-like isoform X1 n=2 Tax=Rhopalosiphum padi TaxID=40932 RepID=UPI00298E5D2D|nr:caspase-3-like isoform X1 [Rhopalosiphum padi]XP_060840022.1 caspase-3-like isoform X1 [Rhopalosiphum padi]XP_060840104.1 caspase-3-like isoform X1 [Rhopalosiphum padi]